MKISELSQRTGVPVASIKYFRRQGLLPAGRATAATLAEYGEEHVQRLRLIKALTTLGGLSIAATRDVLAAVDQADSTDGTLKAISYALPVPVAQAPAGDEERETEAEAAAEADAADLIAAMDWQVPDDSPHVHGLTTVLRELRRLDANYRLDRLAAYGELARSIARLDLERAADFDDSPALAEQAVIVLALSGPVLELLRRLAQEDQVRRRMEARESADS
ncbi:MerR family transcriptional regulator [Streptomyces spectabilis]|uniref:DNA-binding transcriptional MerR regulator n=1 Tax=Streptomyces spectabilis TaxID=68270 RepID=A0A5P2X675_STRST|nr:MerR family transcriptional regulator [Streptomyces spectabilis]UUW33123.1 merr HTh family regulatory protein [Streptomyces sp.]MBB5101303.1 DNA-binding transcriptional MerR regulator [Streptomyces spectabilis]MCI3900502.1 MerR family transcriptional regulator [Streptomyces spectabilis]QEV58076.1 MerR family transcriptional regulator [Streptomyces spectabilis]GGV10543.1 MerR family transcriptional regulator [Streptomyces spectabilis]